MQKVFLKPSQTKASPNWRNQKQLNAPKRAKSTLIVQNRDKSWTYDFFWGGMIFSRIWNPQKNHPQNYLNTCIINFGSKMIKKHKIIRVRNICKKISLQAFMPKKGGQKLPKCYLFDTFRISGLRWQSCGAEKGFRTRKSTRSINDLEFWLQGHWFYSMLLRL